MKPKTPQKLLQEEISILQNLQEYEFLEMRKQFNVVANKLSPSNLVANIFQDVISAPASNNSLLENTIGITTRFLTGKFLFGASASPAKRAIGNLVQSGISHFVYKNSFVIKAIGGLIFRNIFNKKDTPATEKPIIKIS